MALLFIERVPMFQFFCDMIVQMRLLRGQFLQLQLCGICITDHCADLPVDSGLCRTAVQFAQLGKELFVLRRYLHTPLPPGKRFLHLRSEP